MGDRNLFPGPDSCRGLGVIGGLALCPLCPWFARNHARWSVFDDYIGVAECGYKATCCPVKNVGRFLELQYARSAPLLGTERKHCDHY
jgi:hypothetical protein